MIVGHLYIDNDYSEQGSENATILYYQRFITLIIVYEYKS